MTNVPIINGLAGYVKDTKRRDLTYVELGLMTFDVGLSEPDFCSKIKDLINSDKTYHDTSDRIVSFQLRLFCADEEEPFVDEYMILNLAFIGFLTKTSINQDKNITDKFVEFIMDGIKYGS